MSLIGYAERVGTPQSEFMQARAGDIVYTGPGNDQISAAVGADAYLIGGSGNDVYNIPRGALAIVLDTSGTDTLQAPFNISAKSTFAITIDGGRHLVVGDLSTETVFAIIDRYNFKIENIVLNGTVLSQEGVEAAIRSNGTHGGDLPYSMFAELGFGSEGMFSNGVQAEINHILSREAQLFGSANPGQATTPTFTPQPGTGLTTPAAAPTAPPAPGPAPIASTAVVRDWYLSNNPDVAVAGLDPLMHYMQHGWREGRDPNKFFDSDWYLATYADVAAAGVNPIEHYWNNGWKENRDPSTAFDTSAYLSAHPDVKIAGLNPLDHYLAHGINEGRALA